MREIQINIARNKAKGPDLYKIDYGTKIIFTGLELPVAYEVHFGRNLAADALVQIGDSTGVNVPDSLLLAEGTLYGWLYVHTGADDGWTKREFSCAIVNRPGVTNVEPTPVQQGVIEQTIAALNEGVGRVEEAVEGVQEAIETALQEAKDNGEFDGEDGYTPVKGIDYFDGKDGRDGKDGADGKDGEPGKDGEAGPAGVSPTITVTDITGGHRVTITDADGPHSFDVMDGESSGGDVTDVQVNGVSVVSGGVANVPVASASDFGVVKPRNIYGTVIFDNYLCVDPASARDIKDQQYWRRPIGAAGAGDAVFYGLARAAGDTTQAAIYDVKVRDYTETAKSKISQMLNSPVTVSGSTPTITALPGVRYVCGECATLDITLPASGCVDVTFESGSTATVLTITPPTGVTLKWANGFDPTSLDANTTYEINIADGLGVAGSWT